MRQLQEENVSQKSLSNSCETQPHTKNKLQVFVKHNLRKIVKLARSVVLRRLEEPKRSHKFFEKLQYKLVLLPPPKYT